MTRANFLHLTNNETNLWIMLKIFTVLTLLLSFAIAGFSQKLKKRTEKSGYFKTVYYTQKKTGFRMGDSYVLNTQTGDTIAAGKYLNGKRVGNWTFRKPATGQKYLVYDFTSDSLIYLNHELVADTFLVKTDNGFEVKKVDRPVVYVGLEMELYNMPNDILTIEQMKKNLEGMAVLNYRIDTLGNLSGAKVVMELDKSFVQKIDRSMRKLSGKFLPAVIDGKPVESAIYVRLNIQKLQHPSEIITPLPKVSYIYDLSYQYGVQVRRRVITEPYPSRRSMIGY